MSGPPGLLLTFYGDDFTGSTDAMESLTLAGLRTVLFFSPPAPELLESRFADLSRMGVAGTSPTMSPAEMDRELEPILRALWRAGGLSCSTRSARRSIPHLKWAASAMS